MAAKRQIAPDPMIGVLVIGLIALGFSAPKAEWRASTSGPTLRPPLRCTYVIYQDNTCLGAVFLDGPAERSTVLAARGIAPNAPAPGPKQVLPCETCLKVDTVRGSVRCEPMKGRQRLILGRPIDLNRADKDDLTAIRGIGPKLSERIINLRRSLGHFSTVEDLAAVPGLGPKRMNAIRPLVEVRSPAARRESVCPGRSLSP